MSVTVPKAYDEAPLADKLHGKLQRFVQASAQSTTSVTHCWRAAHRDQELQPRGALRFSDKDLNYSFEDGSISLTLKAGNHWFSQLPVYISDALLLENLVEVFGPECLSVNDSLDGQNWSFLLLHNEDHALIEFKDDKGSPRFTFAGDAVWKEAGITLIEQLIARPPVVPPNERDYRQNLSLGFMLRQADLQILKYYHEDWDDEISESGESATAEEFLKTWKVQTQPQTWSHDYKVAIYQSSSDVIDFACTNAQPTSAKDDFNTLISTHLLLLKLLHTFGPGLWRGQDCTYWGMTLKRGSDSWMQIQNDGGRLVVQFQGSLEDEQAAKKLLNHVISPNVTYYGI